MEESLQQVHPRFKFEGIHYTFDHLFEVAYSLIKEGQPYEIGLGDFLMDWISPTDTIRVRTSGSTGAPKDLVLQKQAMVNSALATGSYFGIKEGDSALLCLPGHFIAGRMMFIRAIVLGLELDHVAPTSSPLDYIEKDYDFCGMVPLQLEKSLPKLGGMKTLLVGGAPLSDELRNKAQNVETRIFETYGMTETCTHVAARPVNNLTEVHQNTVVPFKTLPNITVTKDDRDCLVINAPDLLSPPVVTNDIVELASETEFKWLGRFDNIINSGGIKLVPEQIEHKIANSIESRFFVAGIPDDKLGQKLVLVLESDNQPEGLINKLKGIKNLEKFEVPKEILTIPKFKESAGGKVSRKATLQGIV
ncbi:MAG: AMP-binding protein [Eudoraea sp.]|nr:AMP-binding protein [Eudoraea sp.]